MPHQQEGLEYADDFEHFSWLIAMRGGKTLIPIRLAKQRDYIKRCLVIAPLSVLEPWMRELSFEEECYCNYHDVKALKRDDALVSLWETPHRIWVLVNYELVRNLPEITYAPWDMVLADESAVFSNPQSRIAKVMTTGFRLAKHRGILCGLPAPESELQLFSQCQFLHGSFMGYTNYWNWRFDLFEPSPMDDHLWTPKPGVRPKIIQALRDISFIRTKKEMGMNNVKRFERRYVDMVPAQKKIYEQFKKEWAYQKADGTWFETQWAPTAEMMFQRIAGGFNPEGTECLSDSKAQDIIKLAKGELKDEQIVIWFKFKAELDHCLQMFKWEGLRADFINGEVSTVDRERKRLAFQAGKLRYILATESSVKRGNDFSAADTAIYYSNEWSCDDRLQSEERIENPFKKATLLIVDMITRGTPDEDVVNSVRNKGFSAKGILAKHSGVVIGAS